MLQNITEFTSGKNAVEHDQRNSSDTSTDVHWDALRAKNVIM